MRLLRDSLERLQGLNRDFCNLMKIMNVMVLQCYLLKSLSRLRLKTGFTGASIIFPNILFWGFCCQNFKIFIHCKVVPVFFNFLRQFFLRLISRHQRNVISTEIICCNLVVCCFRNLVLPKTWQHLTVLRVIEVHDGVKDEGSLQFWPFITFEELWDEITSDKLMTSLTANLFLVKGNKDDGGLESTS